MINETPEKQKASPSKTIAEKSPKVNFKPQHAATVKFAEDMRSKTQPMSVKMKINLQKFNTNRTDRKSEWLDSEREEPNLVEERKKRENMME